MALGRVLFRGLKRATIGPVGLRPHFLNRGPRPGPIAAAKTRPQTDRSKHHLALGRGLNAAKDKTLGRAYEPRPKIMVLGRVLNAALDHHLRPRLLSAAIGLTTNGLDLSPFGLRPRFKRGLR